MTYRSPALAATVLAVLLLPACGGEPARSATPPSADLARFEGLEGTLDIAGGTAHLKVMSEAAKRIMSAFPKIRITVAGGGSGQGVQQVGEGLVDIGNTGRPVSDAENERYGLTSYPFALDGVAVAVHPDNPVKALTTAQVRAVFAGTITRWKALGGPDRGINLYGRDEASGTRSVFWKQLLDKGAIAPSTNIVTSNGAMKTALSNDEAGIGYQSIGHVDETVAAVVLDGVPATQENATNGTYRVTRRLFMNTRSVPSPLARAFIDYLRSPEGASLVAAAGYIASSTESSGE